MARDFPPTVLIFAEPILPFISMLRVSATLELWLSLTMPILHNNCSACVCAESHVKLANTSTMVSATFFRSFISKCICKKNSVSRLALSFCCVAWRKLEVKNKNFNKPIDRLDSKFGNYKLGMRKAHQSITSNNQGSKNCAEFSRFGQKMHLPIKDCHRIVIFLPLR